MKKTMFRFRKRLTKAAHRTRRQRVRQVRKLKLFGKHPFAVPAITLAALCILSAVALVVTTHHSTPAVNARVVIISHDHQQQIVPSREQTVGALLTKLHIQLHDGDVVEPAPATKIQQDNFRINIYRAVPVEVVDNGQQTFTFSAATTSRSIAKQAGIATYAEDDVSMAPVNNFVTEGSVGQQITIKRATPINVNLYGTQLAIRTQSKTVADLLVEKKITLAKDDQVMPAADTPLTANQQIFIVRNGTKLDTVTQTIAMPVQTIKDPTLAYGTSAVRQQGSAGQQVITYQVNLQNGKEVSRTAIQTVVTTQAVTEIVVQGTSLSGIKGDMALAGIDSSDYNYADYIVGHESNWNPTAQNSSGAYGLCQSLPGSKMASAGSDWATNPITQLKWCNGYAQRYGGWAGAYNHWVAYRNW